MRSISQIDPQASRQQRDGISAQLDNPYRVWPNRADRAFRRQRPDDRGIARLVGRRCLWLVDKRVSGFNQPRK